MRLMLSSSGSTLAHALSTANVHSKRSTLVHALAAANANAAAAAHEPRMRRQTDPLHGLLYC